MKCNQVWYGSKIRAKIFSFKAYGFFRYISDGFNVFDGVIVIFSCLEIYNSFVYGLESGENSGISVLRTFRLLREEDFHIMSSFLNKFVEEMSLLQKRKKTSKFSYCSVKSLYTVVVNPRLLLAIHKLHKKPTIHLKVFLNNWFKKTRYVWIPKDPQVGSLSSQPSATARGHAPNNGQRRSILRASHAFHLHIQVCCINLKMYLHRTSLKMGSFQNLLPQHPRNESVRMQVLRQSAEGRKRGRTGLRSKELRHATVGHRHRLSGDNLRSSGTASLARIYNWFAM